MCCCTWSGGCICQCTSSLGTTIYEVQVALVIKTPWTYIYKAPRPVFKIEVLIWVSFWWALKFQSFNWRVGSNPRRQSKNIEMKHKTHIKLCAWITWYIFLVQCEELRINHVTLLLVLTKPYTCWFLWWANCIEDFKWRLHFQFGVVFGRVVLREVYFEGHWRLQSRTLTMAFKCHFKKLFYFKKVK